MVTISLCMIVKNEEETLPCCLESVCGIADEIIIVDTGSTDCTKEAASKYTNLIYDYKWTDDFSAARNFSFSKASCDYCMWLDADDVLLAKDRENLKLLRKTLSPDTDIVMCQYHTGVADGKTAIYSYYRERIIRNHKGYTWEGAVHEAISLTGKILYADIAVTHKKIKRNDPGRNLRIFRNKIDRQERLNPREQFYYARELFYAGQYNEAVQILEEYIDSEEGWLENKIEACRVLSGCYLAVKDEKKAVWALVKSFFFDNPRAEICCDIGNYFMRKDKYEQAVFWFETAASCKRNDAAGGFVELDCYGYIPYIQLCVCYEKLGNRQKAYQCNEMAGNYKPKGMEFLNNKKYFSTAMSAEKSRSITDKKGNKRK